MAPSPTDADEIDHYKFLDLPSGEEGSRLTADQIEKAYKTQSRLRHPDKRPDDPNATADFQLLRASYDVLRDEQSRRAFDAKLRARREKEVRDSARDGKRRKLAADLEKRERAAERGEPLDAAEMERKRERSVANELKRELDAFLNRNVRGSGPAAASASTSREEKHDESEHKSDKDKMLKVSWERALGEYSATRLREIFEKFGKVEDVVIRSKKSKNKGTALIVMSSKDAVAAATRLMCGDASNPLLVLPFQTSSDKPDGLSVPFAEANDEPKISKIVGAGFSDYEASILKKLQQRGAKT
ncbi:dnaJ subfamily C member 17 isoform X3 [Carex littledalei]|uniref:DnaJ subfamily C member 17 isoform X3 n=1 Tax=Carex littledalei TaxID=544730 RepID=A0A833UZN1_9POAL|nr:dnaJ subfamily C member 17 isoform X3 [Carex littledalei]